MMNIKRTLASLLICFVLLPVRLKNDPVNGNPVDDTPIDNREDTKVDAEIQTRVTNQPIRVSYH